MDWLGSLNLSPEQTGLATLIVIIAGGIFAGWARVFGKKEGAPTPKVQEFYAGGQLADMGPVKELVEGQGLLIQQQVRTNLALEAVAKAVERTAVVAEAYIEDRQKERADKDLEEEVRRRVAEAIAARDEAERPPRRSPR